MRVMDPRALAEAQKLWLANEHPHDIETALLRKYKMSRRTARRYWQRAANRLAEATCSITPEQAKERADRQLLECIEAAKIPNEKTGQPNAAAMIQGVTRLAELHKALVPTVKVIQETPTKPEQVHDELAAIVARAGSGADAGTASKAN